MRWIFLTIGVWFWGASLGADSSNSVLTLESYLEQVKENSRELLISRKTAEFSSEKANLPRLAYSPQLSAEGSYTDSKSEFGFIPSNASQTKTAAASFGVSKLWSTGTTTSLQHKLQRSRLNGLTGVTDANWNNTLNLGVTQSLWRNFFGRKTRADIESGAMAFEAQAAQAQFEMQSLLVDAQIAYWNLALAQAVRKSFEDSLKRNNGILQWNQKRLKLNLVDKGDVLQSKSQVLNLEQNLEGAKTREQEALRLLKSYLSANLEGEETYNTEALKLDTKAVSAPESWAIEQRADLEAARKRQVATEAQALSDQVSGDPELEAFASYGGASFDTSFSNAENQTFDNSFRTYEIGIRLNVPLDFSKSQKVRSGSKKQAEAARLEYLEAQYKLEQNFQNLRGRLQEALRQIELAEELKSTERSKLNNEDRRFKQGRSSSFQVLSFDEDLAQAELRVSQLYAEARNILAQLSLFKARP